MAKVAICIASEYEDSEFDVPFRKLKDAGHQIVIVGTRRGERVSGKSGRSSVTVEASAKDVFAEQFDALVIPGGYSPDHLRLDPAMVTLVKDAVSARKVVAAVCHGPQLLIEADVARNRSMTSWPSVRRDLINAGARWSDQEVVEDGNFITSRKPEDLEAFSRALLRRLAA
jgi:protease I